MTELERKKWKAFVFTVRYDELHQRILMRTEHPQILFLQLQDFERKVLREIESEKRLSMFEYRQLRSRIPRLLQMVTVQLAERSLQ